MKSRRGKSTTKRAYRKRKSYGRKRSKLSKPGHFKLMRWSASDSTNNCHFLIQGNDTVPSGTGTAVFTLANVTAYNELVSLFDNYRITRVMYRWVVTRNPDWNSTTANRGWSVRINWTHDFNDNTAISQSLIMQRSNMRELFINNDKLTSKWYSLKPAVLLQMYESATTTAYQPKWRQWMDTNDNTAPHYGIKFAYDNLYLGCNLRMEAKIYIDCKGVS